MSGSRPYTFDRVVRIIAGLALAAGAIWLINDLKNVLLPFCLACLIAYLLEPVVELNLRWLHLRWRVIAVFLTIIEVTAVAAGVIYFFVPSAIDEIHDMDMMVQEYSKHHVDIPLIPDDLRDYIDKTLSSTNINDLFSGTRLETVLNKSTSLLTATIDFLLHTLEWLLAFIYVIFILIDYRPLMHGLQMLVPPKLRPIATRVSDDIKTNMNHYFRGQIIIAMCAAVLYSIGFSIVGIPLAIVLGVLVGILYIIPYFQYVTLIPVTIVCFIYSLGGTVGFWSELGKCLLVYVCSQCVCDYVLTPKIMGKALGLNPAVILLSLSVWGSLLGIIGMIIALPLTTLLLAYYKEYVINRQLHHAKATTQPPDGTTLPTKSGTT